MTQANRVHSTPPTNTSAINHADPTRRGFITFAAGASVISVGSLAAVATPISATQVSDAPIDPIFTAIDAHRKANAAHWAALKASEGISDWGITEQPCHDENNAFEVLIGAPATTLAGLRAKLEYLRVIAEGEEAWMLDEREGAALLLIDSFIASGMWVCCHDQQRFQIPRQRFPSLPRSPIAGVEPRRSRRTGGRARNSRCSNR